MGGPPSHTRVAARMATPWTAVPVSPGGGRAASQAETPCPWHAANPKALLKEETLEQPRASGGVCRDLQVPLRA